jgi:hypothetical protein
MGKTDLLVPGSGATAFYEPGAPIHPFGPIDGDEP